MRQIYSNDLQLVPRCLHKLLTSKPIVVVFICYRFNKILSRLAKAGAADEKKEATSDPLFAALAHVLGELFNSGKSVVEWQPRQSEGRHNDGQHPQRPYFGPLYVETSVDFVTSVTSVIQVIVALGRCSVPFPGIFRCQIARQIKAARCYSLLRYDSTTTCVGHGTKPSGLPELRKGPHLQGGQGVVAGMENSYNSYKEAPLGRLHQEQTEPAPPSRPS